MTTLEGKMALITGASSGIGRATALALAQAGADIAINYLTFPDWAEKVARQVRAAGRRALLIRPGLSEFRAQKSVE